MSKHEWNKNLLDRQYMLAAKKFQETGDELYNIDMLEIRALLDNEVKIFEQSPRWSMAFADNIEMLDKRSEFYTDIFALSQLDDYLPSDTLEFSEISYKEGTIFSFAHDFYNHLGGEWQRLFNKVYKERNNNICFEANTRGFNTFLPGLKYSYIRLSKDNTIADVESIIHEYAHSISDLMHYREHYYDNYPFIELPSLFFQIVGVDDFGYLFNLENEANTDNIALAKTLCVESGKVVDFARFVSSIEDDDLDSLRLKKVAIEKMSKLLEISKNEARNILNGSIADEVSYTIPYLVALELLHIYEQNEKDALDILKRIICLEKEDPYIQQLEDMHIHLNEHSEQYIKTLMKKH